MDDQSYTDLRLLLWVDDEAISVWQKFLNQFEWQAGNLEFEIREMRNLLSDFNCIRDRDYLIFDTLEDKIEFIVTYS